MRTRHTGKYLVLTGIAGIALVTGCMTSDDSAEGTEIAYALRSELSGSPEGKKTYVCHIPPGNPANAHTIHVGNAAVDAHLAHGDSLGQCGDVLPPDTATSTSCLDKGKARGKKSIQNVITRKGKAWKVTVCHIPPGNPENAHEITVGAPAVRAHLAHGDSLGSCTPVVDTGTVALDDCTGKGGKGGIDNGGTGGTGTGGTGEGGTGGTGTGGTGEGGTGGTGTGGTGEGGTGGTGTGTGTGTGGGSDSTSVGDNT